MKASIYFEASSCSVVHWSDLNLKPENLEDFKLHMAISEVSNRISSGAPVFAKSGIELLIQFPAERKNAAQPVSWVQVSTKFHGRNLNRT